MVTVPQDLEPVFVYVAVMKLTKRAEVRELMRATIDAFFDVMHISPARGTITSWKPTRLIPCHDRSTIPCWHF